MSKPKEFWNPYAAGVALGLVLLGSFVLTGKGLGASGGITRLQATLWHSIDPTWATENANIAGFFLSDTGALSSWIVMLGIGVAVGGLFGAISGGRVKLETIHGPRVSRDVRWLLALIGGIISGVAAQLARGCTSGQALTGGAQLALGSWVFMFAMFGGAYGLAYFLRKQWI
jgi:hypothetical protein